MDLLFLALAPVIVILVYIYIRDKYEKEPVGLLLKTLLAGAIITLPIIVVEELLMTFYPLFTGYIQVAYRAFVVAAFTEELFKFLVLYLLIRRSPYFNERFDGIVYAVFVSLGFAAVENILYVSSGGASVGYSRSLTAVPAHALFGVVMGFYFGKSLFIAKTRYLVLALVMPIFFHGVYDFILMSQNFLLLLLFIPFLIYLWINGFRKINYLSDKSIFKK
jgi:RsiW-degrading membrane proteinase PrsW (M82 family)